MAARGTKAGNREEMAPTVAAVKGVSKGASASDADFGSQTKKATGAAHSNMQAAGNAGLSTMRMARNQARRANFESSAAGARRLQEVPTMQGEGKSAAYARLGYHEHEAGVPHSQAGEGRVAQHDSTGNVVGHLHVGGQPEIPGLGNVREAREHGVLGTTNKPIEQSRTVPDLAPNPGSWTSLHPDIHRDVIKRMAEFGTSPAHVKRAFGARLDQGHAAGAEHGMTPYASHFYTGNDPSRPDGNPVERQPREVIHQSAKNMGVPFATNVVGNSITSPQQQFVGRNGQTGATTYPNDNASVNAISHAQKGETPPRGVAGIYSQQTRAAHAFKQLHEEGRHLDELRNPGGEKAQAAGAEGGSPFGPKTGPYANNLADPHGSHRGGTVFVSDVHSGQEAMVPHLPSEERDRYMQIPHIHELHDHIVREAMQERGLHSVSGSQATQWGATQMGKGLVKEHHAYPAGNVMAGGQMHGKDRVEIEGQQGLF